MSSVERQCGRRIEHGRDAMLARDFEPAARGRKRLFELRDEDARARDIGFDRIDVGGAQRARRARCDDDRVQPVVSSTKICAAPVARRLRSPRRAP